MDVAENDAEARRLQALKLLRQASSRPPELANALRERALRMIRGGRMLYLGKRAEDRAHQVCVALVSDGLVRGSGTIVGSHTVLTAAHVVAERDGSRWKLRDEVTRMRVYEGRSADADPDKAKPIAEDIDVHPGYDARSSYDIEGRAPKLDAALVRVTESFETPPAVLATRRSRPALVEVIGFGSTEFDDRSPERSRSTGVRTAACFSLAADESPASDADRADLGYCPPAEFVLGEREPDARRASPDTRRGDSGGPVLDAATKNLIGLTNRGALFRGTERNCGVYLAVDAITDWLAEHGVRVSG